MAHRVAETLESIKGGQLDGADPGTFLITGQREFKPGEGIDGACVFDD